jgi:formate dehydrogenase (NADP+) alpha subunit
MKITIDKKTIEVDGRITVLETAREHGIYIPSLCDHPRLEPFAACRLCLVEIKGRKGYSPACSTYAEDGLDITTQKPELQKLRRNILEFILSEHPSACLICSEKNTYDECKSTIRKVGETTGCILCWKSGRCDLQKVVEYLRLEKVEFPAVYRNSDVRKDDPFIDRDYNLCILCGRCVRICHEVRGVSALSFIRRGPWTAIGTELDGRLFETDCQFCGACVDVCPTGALAERAVRYDAAPDAKKDAVCAMCGQGCRLTIELREGRIRRSVPADDGVVNKGQACVKGRFIVRDAVSHPRRILRPLVRKNGGLEETSWDDALSRAAAGLSRFKGEDIALFGSAQHSCEDAYLFRKFGREGLTSEHIAGPEDFSAAARLARFERSNGLAAALNFRIADIGKARTIVVFGEDLPAEHPLIWLEVFRALRRGAKMILAASKELCFHRCASGWLRLGPEKGGVLLTALSKMLLESHDAGGAVKADGFAEFQKRLEDFDLPEALARMGIAEEKLSRLALILEKRKPAALLFGANFCEGPYGEANLEAMENLAFLIEGRLFPLAADANTRGALAISQAYETNKEDPDRVMSLIRRGVFKALYLAGSAPKLERGKAEFVIVQSPYATENLDIADVVLPQTTFAESDGAFVNTEGRAQASPRAIEPAGESRPGWRIVRDLAQKMGLSGFAFANVTAVFEAMAKAVPGFHGMKAGGLGRETFLQEQARNGKKFISTGPPQASDGSSASPFDSSSDIYEGLDMAQDHQSLNLIRKRKF